MAMNTASYDDILTVLTDYYAGIITELIDDGNEDVLGFIQENLPSFRKDKPLSNADKHLTIKTLSHNTAEADLALFHDDMNHWISQRLCNYADDELRCAFNKLYAHNAYEAYKLNWMLKNNFTLNDLRDALIRADSNTDLDHTPSVEELWAEFESNIGFKGDLWLSFDEWFDVMGDFND